MTGPADRSTADERLQRLLGGPDTARLLARLRERMARGLPLTGSISLAGPTPAERAAVEALLGRRPSDGRSVTVPLAVLDRLLRESATHPAGLESAVVTLSGPVAVRSETRAAADTAWSAALGPLDALVTSRPELTPWRDGLERSGLVRKLTAGPDAAAALVRRAVAVIAVLPTPPMPLPEFATAVAGSAHALDDGTPLATLVFGAARTLSGMPDGDGARWRRAVWESVGVVSDQLTSTVLVHGLPGDDRDPVGRSVESLRTAGEPAVVTLRQLRLGSPWRPVRGATVSVCENPTVVAAAADRLGGDCAPVVCTAGQPGAAVMLLLEQLVAGGAALRYHGDFDWPGLRIASYVRRHHPWRPWRFTAVDYARTAAVHPGNRLGGTAVVAPWDPELTAIMIRRDVQVEEEAVLDELIADLAR